MLDQAELKQQLNDLWQALAANPRNRALTMSHTVDHHGDTALRQEYARRIVEETPVSPERHEALLRLAPLPALVQPLLPPTPAPLPAEAPANRLRVDAEMGRLAIALDMAAEFRLWQIARDLTRSSGGSGVVEKAALTAHMSALGVRYTPRHFNRLLQQGTGLLWQRRGSTLYLRSVVKVGVALAEAAQAAGIPLGDNLPGVLEMWVEVGGSLEAWEGRLYATWLGMRGKADGIQIARETLAGLFQRTANTLRRWEAAHLGDQVQVEANYAQCGDLERYYDHIPEHATAYVAQYRDGDGVPRAVIRVRWQMVNTYRAAVEPHAHRGQSKRIRAAARTVEQPVQPKRGGHCLRYVSSPEALKRLYRSRRFRMGLLGDVDRPVYVYLGIHKRRGERIHEISNSGFVFTQAGERATPTVERTVLRQRAARRLRWMERHPGEDIN